MRLTPLLCAVLAACSGGVQQPAPPRPDSTYVVQLARGVSYRYSWFSTGPVAMHEVTVDPRACGVDLLTVKGLDRVIGRETTLAMATRTAAETGRPVLAAINADFFSYDPPGVSEGPQISNGRLIKSEGVHREALEDRVLRLQPVFGVTTSSRAFLAHTRFSGTVTIRGATSPLIAINTIPKDSAIHRVPVRPIGSGIGIVGDSILMLVTRASAAAGDTVRWSFHFDSIPTNTKELIGGYPMLLVNGTAVHHAERGLRPAFSDRQHPRSAIAIDNKGRIHLFAVDGRQTNHSLGMSLQQLGDYLRAQGFQNAMNLDGGGSTSLVINGRLMNSASDPNGERAVANALLVLGARESTRFGCAQYRADAPPLVPIHHIKLRSHPIAGLRSRAVILTFEPQQH